MCSSHSIFFFNDTATTEIYTLSLHDALPILTKMMRGTNSTSSVCKTSKPSISGIWTSRKTMSGACVVIASMARSEEHTSELQSRLHLVCRLLLEKKKICEV